MALASADDQVSSARHGPRPLSRGARWATVAGLTLVTFVLLLDDTAVAVALPTIQRQLGLGLGGMEWVINAYTLTLAAFAVLGGRLADRDGRRRMFLAGLAIFVLASLLAGLAPSTAILIAARALQGLGAALVAPASLAIIADAFPKGERGGAIGVWAGISASALGVGPLFGAVLTESIGWTWIFLLNVPLGAATWMVARKVLRESHAPAAPTQLDLVGAAIWGLGLLALLLALTQGGAMGWTSPRIILLLAAAVACLALFLAHERRTPAPLLDLSLFRERSAASANVLILLATAVMCSLFFFLALYLQTVLGFSALASGATLLPLVVTIVIVAPLSGRLADRVGPRIPVTAGMVLLAGGLLGLSTLGVDSQIRDLVPWLVLAGLGIAMVNTPTAGAALGSSDSAAHGTLAAVFSTAQAVGLTLGVAIMGAILASFGPGAAFNRSFDGSHHLAFVRGFSLALMVNAAIALFGALFAAFTMSRPDPRPALRVGLPASPYPLKS
ncbi:MAG: MFS transporter [Candidatus Dormibacteria bacterium]